jgi:hypothetical protein
MQSLDGGDDLTTLFDGAILASSFSGDVSVIQGVAGGAK